MTALRIAIAGGAALLMAVPATAAGPRTHQVVIDRMKFGAMPANARVGDTIVWVNRDMFRHTATVRGAFDVDLPPHSRKAAVLRKAGMLDVRCTFHPGMRATLRVAAK